MPLRRCSGTTAIHSMVTKMCSLAAGLASMRFKKKATILVTSRAFELPSGLPTLSPPSLYPQSLAITVDGGPYTSVTRQREETPSTYMSTTVKSSHVLPRTGDRLKSSYPHSTDGDDVLKRHGLDLDHDCRGTIIVLSMLSGDNGDSAGKQGEASFMNRCKLRIVVARSCGRPTSTEGSSREAQFRSRPSVSPSPSVSVIDARPENFAASRCAITSP
jgi:hypothetical protein